MQIFIGMCRKFQQINLVALIGEMFCIIKIIYFLTTGTFFFSKYKVR